MIDILSAISESMWMWLVGGTCALVVVLTLAIGGFMIRYLMKAKEEIVMLGKEIQKFRVEWAEHKGETITWEKFTPVKRDMENELHTKIELGISQHLQDYSHNIG